MGGLGTMRSTMVNADLTTECLPRLTVRDGNGDWVNITDRLFSISLNDSLGADSASCSLQLRNNPDKWVVGTSNYNLDPLDTDSLYYINNEPLLAYYHDLKLEVSKDAGVHYYSIFEGYCGPTSIKVTTTVKRNDTITLKPADLSFPYKEYHFYDSLIYKDADAVSMMSQIFKDRGFPNQSVTEIDAPGHHVEEITTGETNVWAAQKALILPTGYIYRIKWNVDAFKPCVYDPGRTKTTPDNVSELTFKSRSLNISEADVRSKVVIIYRQRGSGIIEYAQAESEEAKDRYGIPDGDGGRLHKTMWLAVKGSGNRYSLIDTADEAVDLANYVLHDLKYPVPDVEIKIPRINPSFEIHDLLSFINLNDYTVNVGVTSLTWTWDTNNKFGTTTVKGTADRVIGEFGLWLSQDSHSPDVQKDLQLAFLLGDGIPPPTPEKPELLSFKGIDSATGKETTVVVATVTPITVWDLAGYFWSWQIVGEAETENKFTTDSRLVIKDLPAQVVVRVWVQARDWSAIGLS